MTERGPRGSGVRGEGAEWPHACIEGDWADSRTCFELRTYGYSPVLRHGDDFFDPDNDEDGDCECSCHGGEDDDSDY